MSTNAQPAAAPPIAPRRGGRRGGGAGLAGGRGGRSAVNAASALPDDTEEVRMLRAKYANQLALLREMFPDWTDEDLLFALQEAGGEVELAVGRISEGHAEQFSSVKSKKQVKKETGSTATPSTFQGATAPTAGLAGGVAGTTRGGRGGIAGARGGRGGATAARGARGGGRGALRGTSAARGGIALPVDGKSTSEQTAAAGTSSAKGAQGGSTWADAVAATSSKPNGGVSGDWGDDTEGLDLKGASGAAAPTTTAAAGAATSVKPPVQDQSSTAAAASTNTASAEEPGMVASVMAKILPSKLVPKGSKMSWAQVARPAEATKPEISAPVLTGVYTSAAAAAANAPVDSLAQKKQQPSDVGAVKQDEVAPTAAMPSALSSEPAGASAAPQAIESSAIPTSNAVEPTTAGPAGTAAAAQSKPGIGRAAQSQRSVQRAQQQEAVVMAGKNSQYDNLGVRFGSLNFLGGDDNDAQTEEVSAANGPTAAPALGHASTGQQEYSAPTNTYADHFGTTATSAPSAAPLHVQQQTQTTPTHQDAFAQASSAPYNGNKQEASQGQQYGYQQGMSQHQQAHQAAVAQAQQAHQQLPQQSTTTTQVEHQYQQSGADAVSGGYGASPAVQSSQGQHQQPNSQYADYYANLDSQRLASFYGSYDQQSALSARGTEERSASQQTPGAIDQQPHQSHPSAAHASTPQQQQQFPGVMPYYYPQYYLPNQFQQQHYAQPGAGYGQYALYGQQPQHPSSKPAAVPASHQSPYSQNGPAELSGSGAPYGNTASAQYGQSPAAASLTAAGTGYGDGGLGRQGTNASTNDYSKLYGNMATPTSTHSSSIPGLGGFLGQTPSGATNGSSNAAQNKSSAPSNALENAYRGYDNGKMSPAIQGQQQAQQQQAPQQGGAQQPQQQQQQRQQQPGATPQQQQQQYYQQYNAYAAHQPGAATGNYGNYPYTRQYWQ